jgi:hypothetical protein
LWVALMLALSIFLIAIAPPNITAIKPVKEDLLQSRTFAFLLKLFQNRFPSQASLITPANSPESPITPEEVQSIEEYHALMDDERVQSILGDEEIMEAIRQKDYAKLLNSEKIYAVLDDPRLMEKFMVFYKKLGENRSPANPSKKSNPEIVTPPPARP